jgi:hypothetical protein
VRRVVTGCESGHIENGRIVLTQSSPLVAVTIGRHQTACNCKGLPPSGPGPRVRRNYLGSGVSLGAVLYVTVIRVPGEA